MMGEVERAVLAVVEAHGPTHTWAVPLDVGLAPNAVAPVLAGLRRAGLVASTTTVRRGVRSTKWEIVSADDSPHRTATI